LKIIKSDFISKGIRCDGDLLLPDNINNPPVVIMAHGFASQKNFGLRPYAERFIEKDMAVFLFDYRTFGRSDGEPRQIVDPFHHVEDWKAAVAHVRNINEVDGGRISLWGSSFSGGHVISVAASDDKIKAVIAQVPFMSGTSSTSMKSFPDIIKSAVYGIYDVIRNTVGLSPHYSPVIGRSGTFAAMNSEESYDGYMSIVGNDQIWENKVASRVFLKMLMYNPSAKAKKIKANVLIMAAKHDSLIPIKAIEKCAKNITNCKLVIMDCNHFAPYTGETFKKYIGTHVEFLERYLK